MTKRNDKDHRPKITRLELEKAKKEIFAKLEYRLEEKGYGAWLSRHEILGIITEEYDEVIDAVTCGDITDVKEELKDVAVGCLFAIACINAETLDW